MNPANPENVPLDKIPAGWRLIYEEEYKASIPTRLWRSNIDVEAFSQSIHIPEQRITSYTYITPDLPDNGQPWHAHNPGDPAPVEDGAKVDLIFRNGQVFTHIAPDWFYRHSNNQFDILFYRLHEPAPMKTESKPTPPTSDRILSILIAAGHITEEQVEQARKLVKP